jgi:hypothetical protein
MSAPNPARLIELGEEKYIPTDHDAIFSEAARLGMPALALAVGISSAEWEQLGPQAKRIIGLAIPAFVQRFVGKSLHYGPDNANVLGPAGQFSDIWRKIGPLKRALWDGEELTQEPPDEICMDLIGHCLLTIDMLLQGIDRRGSG